MGEKYWIKLYHEILMDPKMGTLPDRLWRRTIEMFLLAGSTFDNGLLPPLDEIAWHLRANTEELETELIELQKIGILSVLDGQWVVTNFQKRQAPMEKSEYMRRLRSEKKAEQDKQPVTNGNKLVTKNVTNGKTESDSDSDSDSKTEDGEKDLTNDLAIIANLYEKTFGQFMTSMQAEKIRSWTDEYSLSRVREALEITALHGGRNLAYTERILMNKNSPGKNGKKPIEQKDYLGGEFAKFIDR
jgi:DnaD/phage-associated family protein